jgi:hypothetical protein
MILFLDDNPARHARMEQDFPGEVIHAYDIDSFRDELEKQPSFEKISLDYDLNDFDDHCSMFLDNYATGLDACGFMMKYKHKLPPIIDIHSSNRDGADEMMAFLKSRGIDCRWKMFQDFPIEEDEW